MKSKMTTHSQLSTIEPKQNKNKNKLDKELEQEQNHRNGDHMGDNQWGVVSGAPHTEPTSPFPPTTDKNKSTET